MNQIKKHLSITVARRKLNDRRLNWDNLCDSPLCLQFEVEFDSKTFKLVRLHLPDPEGDPEKSIDVPLKMLDAQGRNAALKALKKATPKGLYETECDDGCDCRMGGAQGANWSAWLEIEIAGGFSVPNPNPNGPKSLIYIAFGTVKIRSRLKVGNCFETTG